MKSLYVTQDLRPLRLCFLVGHNTSSILKAIAINTTLWGGIYNPIVDFKVSQPENIKRNLGLIHIFDPDFIIDLSDGLPGIIKNKIEQPILAPSDFFNNNHERNKSYKIGLRAYGAFLDEIPPLVGLPDRTKEKLSLIKAPSDNLSLFYAANFGFLDGTISPDLIEILKNRLEIGEVTLGFNQFAAESSKYAGPIVITTSQLRAIGGGGGFSDYLIFIGSCRNKDDILEFWNLRASGKVVFFLPIEDYSLFQSSLKEFIGGLTIDERFQRLALDLQISPSLLKNTDKFNEIANWIKDNVGTNPPRRLWLANWGRKIQRVSPDISWVTAIHSTEKTIVNYSKNEVSSFNASSPKFINDSFHKKNAWAIDLSFIGYYEDDFTLDLPNQKGMQDLAMRDLVIGGWERSRISNQGLVFYPDSKDDTIPIQPVPVKKVVETIFNQINYRIKPSTPGILAQKILQKMGGLEDCRVFKIKGVREALTRMNKVANAEVIINGKKLRGEVAKPNPMLRSSIMDIIRSTNQVNHGANWVSEIYDDLILSAGQPRPLTPDIVFDYLTKNKIIKPGRKFPCANCSLKSWYKIGNFSETFRCSHCGSIQDTPRIDDSNWFYKTEGLVAIAQEGMGSLPVILSLWRLSHHADLGQSHFITSFEIGEADSESFDNELDYFFFKVNSFSRNIDVVLGEARNYGEYKPKDIKKVITIARKFENKPYLAFTTLRDKFSDHEIAILKKVLEKGFYVLPFTRLDLDPYDLFDRFDSLRNKYAVTFKELSINLCSLNLNIPEGEVFALIEKENIRKAEKIKDWLAKKQEQLKEK